MARGADGRFTKPGGYILNMLLFMLVVGLVVYFLSPYGPQPTTLLLDAFNANPALNGHLQSAPGGLYRASSALA